MSRELIHPRACCPEVLLGGWRRSHHLRRAFDLGSIRGMVHIWQGAHDRIVPFAHGQSLAAHIRTACVHLYPEHGHLSLPIDSFPAIHDELQTG